jgi:DsbC/DsbD-like thiol-disulfide interchange protein
MRLPAGWENGIEETRGSFSRSRKRRATLAAALLCACAVLFLAWRAEAQAPGESHAKVALIAEENSAAIKAIGTGVLFQLDPGWHIYWQNAGDSGEPPRIQWDLPEGFRAGPIQWPQPIRLGSGSLVDYGYENEVLLLAAVERTAGGQAEQTIAIGATVKYVVCREICIPGTARLTLSIPATDETAAQASQRRRLFQQSRTQLPKTMPANWKASAELDKDQFILSVRTGTRVRSATFFPLEAGQIENSASQIFAASDDGFRLTLRKSDQLNKPAATMRGVIVLGPGRAYKIAAPIAAR